jgi:hypothetical protein
MMSTLASSHATDYSHTQVAKIFRGLRSSLRKVESACMGEPQSQIDRPFVLARRLATPRPVNLSSFYGLSPCSPGHPQQPPTDKKQEEERTMMSTMIVLM